MIWSVLGPHCAGERGRSRALVSAQPPRPGAGPPPGAAQGRRKYRVSALLRAVRAYV